MLRFRSSYALVTGFYHRRLTLNVPLAGWQRRYAPLHRYARCPRHTDPSQYYVTGVEALYFYDYFLTLSDEVRRESYCQVAYFGPSLKLLGQIKYIWQGKRTWSEHPPCSVDLNIPNSRKKAFYLFILVSIFLRTVSDHYLYTLAEQVHPNVLRWMDGRRFVMSSSYSGLNNRPTSDNSSH